ncbi:Os05g0577000, partial [Oryza sativa Japonica Group]
ALPSINRRRAAASLPPPPPLPLPLHFSSGRRRPPPPIAAAAARFSSGVWTNSSFPRVPIVPRPCCLLSSPIPVPRGVNRKELEGGADSACKTCTIHQRPSFVLSVSCAVRPSVPAIAASGHPCRGRAAVVGQNGGRSATRCR